MAIAYDATAESTYNTLSWTHTCTGSNLILIVGVSTNYTSTSGVTYNSVSMTKIVEQTDSAGQYCSMWYLVNPATGSNTIIVSASGTTQFRGTSVSYTGINQTSPIDSSNSGHLDSSATTLTENTTVVGSNCWIVGFYMGANGNTATPSATSNKTDREHGNVGSNTYQSFALSDSNGTVSTGSQGFTWTDTGGGTIYKIGIVASLAQYTAPATNGNFLAFM